MGAREVRRNLEIMVSEGTVQDLNVSGGLHVVITAEGLRLAERLRATQNTPAARPIGFGAKQPGVQAILDAAARSRQGDLAAESEVAQGLQRLRALPPVDRIQAYQALREAGVIGTGTDRLILAAAEEIAGERATAALDKYPDAAGEDEGERIYDMHISEVLRQHGEEELAERWEDPEQRGNLLEAINAEPDPHH